MSAELSAAQIFLWAQDEQRKSERIFFYLSADLSAALFLKMSAELSAAHDFRDERERERERHFLMSDSYSVHKLATF